MIAKLTGKILKVDRARLLAFAGMKERALSDSAVEERVAECEQSVLDAQRAEAVYSVFPLKTDGKILDLGFTEVASASLAKHLKGCDRIAVFVATVGAEIDRLIERDVRISASRASITQAAGSALIEQWCDDICRRIIAKYPSAQRARFSCGYGDLELELQREIFSALSVTKALGITLSDNCFMTPTKSVSAIVGIGREK